jgi:hypothetical protein
MRSWQNASDLKKHDFYGIILLSKVWGRLRFIGDNTGSKVIDFLGEFFKQALHERYISRPVSPQSPVKCLKPNKIAFAFQRDGPHKRLCPTMLFSYLRDCETF